MEMKKMKKNANKAISERKRNEKKLADEIIAFYRASQRNKRDNEQFDLYKKEFYASMLEAGIELEKVSICDCDIDAMKSEVLKIQKIVKRQVIWNPEKLAKRVGKKIAKQILNKKYAIIDFEGFAEYLKFKGISGLDVKPFLSVTKEVNEDALNNLHELGKVSDKQIAGCFKVIEKAPYYRVSKIKSDE